MHAHLSLTKSPSLDEEPGSVRDERTLFPDAMVEREKACTISLHAEVGHDPHDQSQEVHDGSDVVEYCAEALRTKVHHLQPRSLG
jgi:hypothetical protein